MKLQNLIHILIGIVCIGLLPKAQAVSPAPDGDYPGGNTAEGQNALFSLTTGGYNTATGWFSLKTVCTGSLNTAFGAGTLLANTGEANTATGGGALMLNSTGAFNTASGYLALSSNTTGFNNTAIGTTALQNNTTGTGNLALGVSAGAGVTTASNVIAIGTAGADESNTCFIGNIFGVATFATAVPALIDSAGQLGTLSSSRRFKKEIKPMDSASEAILSLKPVTFHYKSDKTGTPQFGLIAEEVAAVNPDLVVCDKNADLYSVRYEAVNAMLLNEFLKEHRTVQELKSIVAKQEATGARQQKEIQALTEQAAQIQKVSDQLAAASRSGGGLYVNKFAAGRIRRGETAPQIVLNNQ